MVLISFGNLVTHEGPVWLVFRGAPLLRARGPALLVGDLRRAAVAATGRDCMGLRLWHRLGRRGMPARRTGATAAGHFGRSAPDSRLYACHGRRNGWFTA